MSIKLKRGRPTKYSTNIPKQVIDYIDNCIVNKIFPTIEGLSVELGIGSRTVYDWEQVHEDFSQTLGKLRDVQKQLLITNGLTGGYNTRFSIFLLKAAHGMTEKEPLINATQNSFMSIAPEVLADALKLMRQEQVE
jgi:hypothetical protein